MNKKILLFGIIAIVCVVLFTTCKEKPGSIYVVIKDNTGTLIHSASVQLHTGIQATLNSDSCYEFAKLKAGNYTLYVRKTGYKEWNRTITVEEGEDVKVEVQIEKLPSALHVINDDGEEINKLDFGRADKDTIRSFNIFNVSQELVEWQITKTVNWITSISETEGVLPAGKKQSIVVTIDRNLLEGGENAASVMIAFNNENKELLIKAIGRDKALATLNAMTVSDITTSTAVLKGKITFEGTPPYTKRGFVYSITSMPILENSIADLTAQVNANTEFSATAVKLTLGETYYIRAYAVNTTGTAYSSNEVNFTTTRVLPQITTQNSTDRNIGAGTVTLHGTIVNAGDPAYSERGFVYGTTHNPTVEDNTRKPVTGLETGIFSANISGLIMGNVYYVRAYAINAQGTAYGAEVILDFNAVMPTLNTQAVTDRKIGAGTATFNGTILTVGDPAYSERGFVYGTTHNPTVEDDTRKPVTGFGTGVFSANISGIVMGNIYYARAYAINAQGTVYGVEVTLDFNAIMPQVTTQAISDIDETSVTFNGTITAIGDPTYTEKGFVYDTNQNPTVENATKTTVLGNGTGVFSASVSSLIINVTYYVRAYATNSEGSVYGTSITFKLESSYFVILPTAGLMVQKIDINGINYVTWSSGNSLCENSTLAGYTDWRLPTKDELAMLYYERNTVGGFVTQSSNIPCYWSSTTSSHYGHWYQDFSNGTQYGNNGSSYRCRCVRTLP